MADQEFFIRDGNGDTNCLRPAFVMLQWFLKQSTKFFLQNGEGSKSSTDFKRQTIKINTKIEHCNQHGYEKFNKRRYIFFHVQIQVLTIIIV